MDGSLDELPLQDPATVFLKEFLPDTRPVALNELQTLRHLQGHLPLRKWHAATATVTTQPPFVPLLGKYNSTACWPASLHDASADAAPRADVAEACHQ